MDSLKTLDPKPPIREATKARTFQFGSFVPLAGIQALACWQPNLMIAKMDEPLAEVLSPVKFGNRTWAAFDPVNDVFAITQSAFTNPPGQSRNGLFVAVLIIEYEKPGHSRPLHEQMPFDPRSGRRWIPTRYRSGAADHDARADGELR